MLLCISENGEISYSKGAQEWVPKSTWRQGTVREFHVLDINTPTLKKNFFAELKSFYMAAIRKVKPRIGYTYSSENWNKVWDPVLELYKFIGTHHNNVAPN